MKALGRLPTDYPGVTVVSRFLGVDVSIVKLMEIDHSCSIAAGGLYKIVLSDEVDEPGTRTYFLVRVQTADSENFWLVDELRNLWPVQQGHSYYSTPTVHGNCMVVLNSYEHICTDELELITKAIEQYGDD